MFWLVVTLGAAVMFATATFPAAAGMLAFATLTVPIEIHLLASADCVVVRRQHGNG
jgi:hypothetical protein